MKVELTSEQSSVYFVAADEKYMTQPELDLEKAPKHKHHETPRLLRDGHMSMQNLHTWLKAHGSEKFVIFMHFTHPHAPSGTLNLLSTPAYKAFSLPAFALTTFGMLSPEIARIEVPILGFDWLFPRRPCDGSLTKEQETDFAMSIFKVVEERVNITGLGLSAARYVWDPSDPSKQDYIFVPIPARRGHNATWEMRAVNSSDTITFRICAALVAILGLVLGFAVIWYVQNFVVPSMMRKIRKMDMAMSASYRLAYTPAATTWGINACFVMYPKIGVLLRWQVRPLQARFVSMSITATPWPAGKSAGKTQRIDGIDPGQMPIHPDVPGQQLFCFAMTANPPDTQFYTDPIDIAIAGTCALRKDGKEKAEPLVVGKPYQFQILAYDSGNRIVEKSNCSRPVMIRGEAPFAQYPLLLWKATAGVIPSDTFKLFLSRYCLSIKKITFDGAHFQEDQARGHRYESLRWCGCRGIWRCCCDAAGKGNGKHRWGHADNCRRSVCRYHPATSSTSRTIERARWQNENI
jgi:hypothetical protein